jgi:hypothetical protein
MPTNVEIKPLYIFYIFGLIILTSVYGRVCVFQLNWTLKIDVLFLVESLPIPSKFFKPSHGTRRQVRGPLGYGEEVVWFIVT